MFFEIKDKIKELKPFCDKDDVLDIVITDYLKKNKLINLKAIVLFKNNKKENSRIVLEVKKILSSKQINPEISYLCIESLFYDKLLFEMIHKGFSIKKNNLISKSLKQDVIFLITYDLKSLDHSKKTLFGYALKGRKNEDGFLGKLKGQTVGRNNIIIPCDKLQEIKEFFHSWKVDYSVQKFMRINE
ncbi:MAG: hypothetical protein PHV16_02820 [Candidatus Nanoarchaeia archaeon]|nr:hypothetical protein [Candidatus Nanoarchaeia archaeon]